MTIEQKIARIIEDVCTADPTLHSREGELRPIVRALLEAQPDTKFDDAFAARVRKQVLAEASKSKPAKSSWLDRLRAIDPGAPYVLGAAALGLVVAVGLAVSSMRGIRVGGDAAPGLAGVEPSLSLRPHEERGGTIALAGGAFGPLDGITAQAPSPEGLGGGGGRNPAPTTAVGLDKMMVPPDYQPTVLHYAYRGEITPADAKVTVYRRVKGFAGATAGPVVPVTNGVVDLSAYGGAQLQNFSILDDRDFGYNVFVDAMEGTVNFSQYWAKWPHPDAGCQDEECFRRTRLKPEDMLSDDKTIAIADAFLAQYGIAKDAYGQPETRNEYARAVALAGGDASQAYVPESVPVVYPLVIDGLTVHDQSGETGGMLVGVSMRYKKVDNVWGITSTRYESSSYDGETDVNKLKSYLESGGQQYEAPGAKVIEVPVGDPTRVLVRIWRYHDDGSSEELYVPALRFPVLEAPKDQAWAPSAVVVPLAKDAVERSQPVPTPLGQPVER